MESTIEGPFRLTADERYNIGSFRVTEIFTFAFEIKLLLLPENKTFKILSKVSKSISINETTLAIWKIQLLPKIWNLEKALEYGFICFWQKHPTKNVGTLNIDSGTFLEPVGDQSHSESMSGKRKFIMIYIKTSYVFSWKPMPFKAWTDDIRNMT